MSVRNIQPISTDARTGAPIFTLWLLLERPAARSIA
jgi:hypothetical protein